MKTSTLKLVRDAVMCDSVGKNKEGNIVCRRGYFYRMGDAANNFAARISSELTKAGVKHTVVNQGDHWAAFRGGQSVKAGSHFWVELRVEV